MKKKPREKNLGSGFNGGFRPKSLGPWPGPNFWYALILRMSSAWVARVVEK